jgi:hypothetical protein
LGRTARTKSTWSTSDRALLPLRSGSAQLASIVVEDASTATRVERAFLRDVAAYLRQKVATAALDSAQRRQLALAMIGGSADE